MADISSSEIRGFKVQHRVPLGKYSFDYCRGNEFIHEEEYLQSASRQNGRHFSPCKWHNNEVLEEVDHYKHVKTTVEGVANRKRSPKLL